MSRANRLHGNGGVEEGGRTNTSQKQDSAALVSHNTVAKLRPFNATTKAARFGAPFE
jgi:hypothetical protein